MCGRYTTTARDPQVIMQRFEIKIEPWVPERALGRANIAPTQSVLAVVNTRTAAGRRSRPASGWPRPGRSCAAARR
jgi:putative SOS response-associated peptidase YedK